MSNLSNLLGNINNARKQLNNLAGDIKGTIAGQWVRNRRCHRTGRFAMHKTVYLVASLMALALSAKAAAQNPAFQFFNSHTGMCLEPQNESMLQGTAIVQQPCKASGAQDMDLSR